MRRESLAIVGNGMATCRLLDQLILRGGRDRYEIAVYGEEAGGAYSRVLLSRVLGGGRPDDIVTKPRRWYDDIGIRLVDATPIARVDLARRALLAKGGLAFPFDVAVLATGSQPLVPPIHGMRAPSPGSATAGAADGELRNGVFVYRTMADCLRLRAHARPGGRAVVLGGGLLGLEAAKVLRDIGLEATVVHVANTILNAQLDAFGGGALQRRVEQLGIAVRTGRTVEAIVGAERVEGVVLDDGRALPADTVVVACGVRPRVDLALASGIAVNRGILVDDELSTGTPGVYAVGECIEHAGRTYGIVSPVWEQATVLAGVLTGGAAGRDGGAPRYRGSNLYSRLKVAGVDVASMGLLEPERETDAVVQVLEERRDVYRKLIVRDGRLLGAMLVGETSAAPGLAQLLDRGELLPDDPLEALCFSSVPRAAERTVCNCHEVTESCILRAVSGGARSVDAVGVATRAGTGCGSCRGEIAELVALRERQPAASPLLARSA